MTEERNESIGVEERYISWYGDMLAMADWCGGVCGQDHSGPAYLLLITRDGPKVARVFDYVVKYEDGTFNVFSYHTCRRMLGLEE